MTARPIKFRAWTGERFIYNDHSDVSATGGEYEWSPFCFIIESDSPPPCGQYVLEQFTGLLDKNEKEIYEGDIVAWSHDRFAPVTYENGCFYTVTEQSMYRLGGWKTRVEVIGNIHQNADLLKEASK